MSRSKSILSLLCCLFISLSASAQLASVRLNITGTRVLYGVMVDGLGEVIIDTYGDIRGIIPANNATDKEYYSDRNSYEAWKVKSIGGVEFTYYSNFNSYEAGKVKSIGDVKLTYYSNFNDYEAGKIKTLGRERIKYYSDFNDYEAGKVRSISRVTVKYYSKFNDYEAAKIKSIGSKRYEYYSSFNDDEGRLKSGETNFTIDSIRFTIHVSRSRTVSELR